MKKFLAFLAIFTIISPVFAATRYVTTQTPIRGYNDAYTAQNYYGLDRLADVERSVYGTAYPNQNINTRLNRLKQSVFNRTYPNATVEQRINNLVVNYNNNNNMMPVNTSNSKLRNVIDSVSSNFFGCPTGMTPPVNPYYSYGPNSYGSNYGKYKDYYDRNGWRMNNESIGNGTGIHILD